MHDCSHITRPESGFGNVTCKYSGLQLLHHPARRLENTIHNIPGPKLRSDLAKPTRLELSDWVRSRKQVVRHLPRVHMCQLGIRERHVGRYRQRSGNSGTETLRDIPKTRRPYE